MAGKSLSHLPSDDLKATYVCVCVCVSVGGGVCAVNLSKAS